MPTEEMDVMPASDTGKGWFQAMLPSNRVFLALFILLLAVLGTIATVNQEASIIWAMLMVPVLIAALFYPRRVYLLVLGLFVFCSFVVVALAARNALLSIGETAVFTGAIALAGEVLYRLTYARRRAEEALRESEQRFRSLSATAPVGIFETYPQGDISYANARFRAIFGLPPDGPVSKRNLGAMSDPIELEAIISQWRQSLQRGEDFRREYAIHLVGGEERWIDVRATPMRVPSGTITSYVGTVEDITERRETAEALLKANDELEDRVRQRTDELTAAVERLEQEIVERKHAQEALSQSEERFSTAFQVSPAALAINRLGDGRFITVNDAFLKSTGHAESHVLGHTPGEVGLGINPEDQAQMNRTLAEAGSVNNLEVRFHTALGDARVGLLSIEPIEIAGEKCMLSITTDITERKEMEKQLEEYARSLNQLLNQLMNAQEAERRRLAMDIHDGPLQSLGVSLLALDRAVRRLEREEYEVVDRELRYLRTTLAGTVSEVRAVLGDLSLEVLNTYGLVFALQGHIERMADVTGMSIQLVNEMTRRASPEVELLMYRLAQEALANVRKHAHAQNASVNLYERDGKLHMTISDDGRGFRVRTALLQHEDGDKLGLRSMVQRVQAMGGDLQITSTPGEGSTLEFWCPLGTRHQSGILSAKDHESTSQ